MKTLQGPVLDPVPAFDRLAEEPDLDLLITTRGDRWEAKIRVNGQPIEPSKIQRDYAAALTRLAAHHLSHHPQTADKTGTVLYEAREARWQMRLALDYFVDMLQALVVLQGPANTARLLDMAPQTVEMLNAAPCSERPNLLAEIGAFNVSRKERKKIAKTLASLALLPLADDRNQRKQVVA